MAKRKMSTWERLQKGLRLSGRERDRLRAQLQSADPGLTVVHPDAAGIDAGSRSHFVAVPGDRDSQPVREFGSWTADLKKLAAWLKTCGIRTVAMQSTGVYWIALQEVLEAEGIEVYLVNARGTKNLPGRKSDVQECQWLMKLHTYGLLRNSFRPPEQIQAVRTVWRLRQRLVTDAGRTIQQMQKALITMNVQLSHAISDISGVTGLAIIRAIVKGERDPMKLAKLRDRTHASEEELAHSLEGHWREDTLFELEQVLECYDFQQKQISECDRRLQHYMAAVPEQPPKQTPDPQVEEAWNKSKKKKRQKTRAKNQPGFDLRGELQRVFGADLTRIDGIDVMTAQMIFSELGSDLSAFVTEDAFVSWLELAPRRDITGGKVVKQKARYSKNRVANAFRMAAEALIRSDSYLGARYRRLRGRKEGPCAVKAMARYLACLVWRLLTHGQQYVDRGAAYFERQREDRELAALERKAAQYNRKLVLV